MKNDMQPEWEREVRDEIVEMGRRLHMLGLVAGCDGNLSCRLDDDRILITPSGYSLGFLKPNKLVTVDMKGQILY
ncbi:MAG: class II aldolase/adducin family protein, partial [Ardenticatenaceae bacterium]